MLLVSRVYEAMSENVDFRPAPQWQGSLLHSAGGSPIWFAEEHHALAHAKATVRIFASEHVIFRTISPPVRESSLEHDPRFTRTIPLTQ
jgi:hypothetical protein